LRRVGVGVGLLRHGWAVPQKLAGGAKTKREKMPVGNVLSCVQDVNGLCIRLRPPHVFAANPAMARRLETETLLAATDDFRRALLDWYHEHRRRLPWREAPSAYKTVVSEFMLQQTQVKTALPYFDRWMKALPDFRSLAAADEAQVLKLWEEI